MAKYNLLKPMYQILAVIVPMGIGAYLSPERATDKTVKAKEDIVQIGFDETSAFKSSIDWYARDGFYSSGELRAIKEGIDRLAPFVSDTSIIKIVKNNIDHILNNPDKYGVSDEYIKNSLASIKEELKLQREIAGEDTLTQLIESLKRKERTLEDAINSTKPDCFGMPYEEWLAQQRLIVDSTGIYIQFVSAINSATSKLESMKANPDKIDTKGYFTRDYVKGIMYGVIAGVFLLGLFYSIEARIEEKKNKKKTNSKTPPKADKPKTPVKNTGSRIVKGQDGVYTIVDLGEDNNDDWLPDA